MGAIQNARMNLEGEGSNSHNRNSNGGCIDAKKMQGEERM